MSSQLVPLTYLIWRANAEVTVKVCTLVTRVRLVTSSASQSRKWQLIGMSQWYRSALCVRPLPMLKENLARGAASRHTIASISHTMPSARGLQ